MQTDTLATIAAQFVSGAAALMHVQHRGRIRVVQRTKALAPVAAVVFG